jgi:hypothetical protein
VPGSGPVSITAWVYGLEPGEWTVNAELLGTPTGVRESRVRRHGAGRGPIRLAAWSWRGPRRRRRRPPPLLSLALPGPHRGLRSRG